MTVPLLVVDDSSFARKQVIRALPKGWDVEVSQASNGEQALELIKAGKGDVVLLDLTMPVMDGFAVLEEIKARDLPAVVIVISGDIQPEAEARVMKLGALAFIKKPLDSEQLHQVLSDFGILSV
ncbi:response regulator [Reinekea blandensis]|uniref:Response regulator n=1 Tax=Reinekea blandensis MED297 TaxID=314283 RepID=A4BIU9_9GAMM|nr:response regulator [Reinekea blandensis]EAR07966.1 response regulator [Reinekea sp. MED297] [Reinekea blandensis MED297]